MPCDYKEYHQEWKRISRGVIEAAGNKCELCYAPNHARIYRNPKTAQYPWTEVSECKTGGIKIVLTVHHIDGNKDNNNKLNLMALCQRCHLKLDMQKHVANRRKNKRRSNECRQMVE